MIHWYCLSDRWFRQLYTYDHWYNNWYDRWFSLMAFSLCDISCFVGGVFQQRSDIMRG